MNKRTYVAPGLRQSFIVAVAVLLLAATCSWPAHASSQDAAPQWLLSLFSWLAAVNTHRPGQADAAVGAGVNQRLLDLQDALGDLLELRDRMSKARDGAVKYQDHEFSVPQLRTIMGFGEGEPAGQGLNRLLRRAAVYHADVALITSRDDASARGLRRPGRSSHVVGDGQPTRQTTSTVHWAFGRELLDHLDPGPARDPLARAWYLATASVLQSLRLVSEADDHLSRARQIFPDDARLLFEGACAVETLTAPTLRAAIGPITQGPRPGGTFRLVSSVPSVRSLLDRAEQLFRRALQRDPTLTEARVRLARLTAGHGRHAESIDLLQQALSTQARDDVRYLALMQLGDEKLAVGRRAEARGHYEAAAGLFRTAQAPLLALGLVARDSGDRAGAIAALDRLARLPGNPEARIDPAWAYYVMQGGDADRLMQQLYALVEKEGAVITPAFGVRRAASGLLAAAIVLVAAVHLPAVISAQQAPTFSSRVEAVRVDVLVTENRQPVRGLKPGDFEVFDNGVRQQVDLAAFDSIPLNVVLALDVSGSMVGEPLAELKAASRAMLAGLAPDDRAALLTFSHLVDVRQSLTTDRGAVIKALEASWSGGETALVDAAQSAIVLGESDVGRALVVLFSDGVDTTSWLAPAAVLRSARRTDAVVYAVSSSAATQKFVGDLCETTGGRLLEVESADRLTPVLMQILQEFRQRYVISYTPGGVSRDGWHALQVRVKGRGFAVRARPGYLAGPPS